VIAVAKKVNIAIYTILLILLVTSAYAPDEGKDKPKEKSPVEIQLATIEKKIDDLIAGKEAASKQFDEITKQLTKIEELIRTRCK
jgi:hypothetical protein